MKQKAFKYNNLETIKGDIKMGIFGRGKGFLGLSKKHNIYVGVVSTLATWFGIAYFISIKQPLSAMGVLAVWMLIMIETYR